MLTRATDNVIRATYLLALLLVQAPALAADTIPASEIADLQQASEKARAGKPGSAEQRRACKRVVRGGGKLLERHPDDPKRFQLLGLMLQNQKVVLKLEATDRNRDVLFDICSQLTKAPGEWAGMRLEADLLLSERDQSDRDASLEERAQALEELIRCYRGTTAEPKSLMIGAMIARDLGSRELQYFVEQTMDERCADNPEVIAFRRKVLSLKSLAVKCKGRYERADGTTLYVPGDRIGHQCLLVYWSQESSAFERFAKEIQGQQDLFPGAFEVYSFNLDELPDAGETALRAMGLDWHAMHLPDGKRNVAFQAYGAASPMAIFVNAFGYTVLNPFGASPDTQGWRSVDGGVFKISASRISHDRYLAQLQSLFIGEFLVGRSVAVTGEKPADATGFTGQVRRAVPTGGAQDIGLRAIQDCFVAPPFRYRLTREESVANYTKAEKLCGEAIKQHPDAADLWTVRNHRIIALLGMWNLVCDTAYLEQAVQEARTVLAAKVSPEEGVVARFCLAKEALRQEGPDPVLHIRKMLQESGGDDAPVSAVAAAAILALEANDRVLHEEYRTRMLAFATDSAHPMWGVRLFLLNRYHRFYLLSPNTTRGDRMGWTRAHIVNHGWNTNAVSFPKFELKNLDGTALSLPDDTNGRLTLLLFIEPPSGSEADFRVVQGKKGFVPKDVFQPRDYIRGVVESAVDLADRHVNREVDVRLAFLTDDAQRVERLMKTNNWTCATALVPGGLENPMVQQLGILSADRLPNVFLLRRDGTVAWNCSGLVYKSEFGFPFAITLAMKVHIEISDIQLAYRALEQKNYRNAARIFAGPYLPFRPERFAWRSPRHHGRALAQMGLKDWEAALESIEKAIDAHKLRHNHGFRRGKRIEDWRKDAARVVITTPCDVFTELWTIKALILQQLGRQGEAKAVQGRASEAATPDRENIYGEFHEQLRAFRLKELTLTRVE